MKAMTSAALALVVLTGCEPHGTKKWEVEKAASEAALMDAAKVAVADAFLDPDSALFRHMKADLNQKTVCGQVNAKNRMGGYAGYQSFVYVSGEGRYDKQDRVHLQNELREDHKCE